MAEEELYGNADMFEMGSTPPVGRESSIYANVRPEDAVASKPSGAVKNYSRWATGSLGLLCVLLLTLSIGLSFKFMKERGQLQAEMEHLLTSYMDIAMERDQLLANNTNLTRQVDQLRVTEGELQDRISKLKKQCPSGWIYFNTKCYLSSSSEKTWSESRTECQTHGGDLVIISSREEQVFIQGLGKSVWIGLRKDQGVWKWVNNQQLSISYWYEGQPDDSTEDCVLLSLASNALLSWHDYPCNDKGHFICKISAYV